MKTAETFLAALLAMTFSAHLPMPKRLPVKTRGRVRGC